MLNNKINMKRCCFKTLGCKANQYDTQVLRESFLRLGYTEIEKGADVCIVNTCTVTEQSDRKSRYLIRQITRVNPGAKVIVTGCLAQLDHEEIAALPGVSMVVKNDEKDKIPELVNGKTLPPYEADSVSHITNFHSHTRAFVKVQDGCDRNCTYCRVRLARGPSRSSPLNKVINEVRVLTNAGYKEVVLTGIQLGAYGRDLLPRSSLGGLIEEVVKVKGLIRLRLSSIELTEITEEIIDQFSVSDKLCRHLHIPLQSGDDKILKSMGRDYKASDYRERVSFLRSLLPELSLTTDIIVGFPGEGEKEFNNTLDFIREVGFLRIHVFPYSPRPGTPAYHRKPNVNSQMIRNRVNLLRNASAELSKEHRLSLLGKRVNVLIESERDRKTGFLTGVTEGYLRVYLSDGDDLKNELVEVKVLQLLQDGVEAEL